jgi:hypothetical protein
LQFNDLEQYGTELWIGWVLAYGVTAIVSLISAWGDLPRPLYIAGAALALDLLEKIARLEMLLQRR